MFFENDLAGISSSNLQRKESAGLSDAKPVNKLYSHVGGKYDQILREFPLN